MPASLIAIAVSHAFSAALSSFCVCIKNVSWSAKQQLHRQHSVVATSHHLTLTEDKSRQCGTSFIFHHKDTHQWLSGPFLLICTTVTLCSPEMVKQGQLLSWKIKTLVGELWCHPQGKSWPPEPTSSFLSIDFWSPHQSDPATKASWRHADGWFRNELASCPEL